MTAHPDNKLATQDPKCIRHVHKVRSLARRQNLIIIMYSNEGGTLKCIYSKAVIKL